MKKRSGIIVAGGLGVRMDGQIPKQFMLLKSKPVLLYSLERFFNFDSTIQIIVVLPEAHIDRWRHICDKHKVLIPHDTVVGGSERFFSVKSGLEKITDSNFVAVHDGVRPLVSVNLITSCFNEAEKYRAVVPALKSSETVRFGNSVSNKIINRDEVFLVQTPQVFETNLIASAYKTEFDKKFTDDAVVVERLGCKIKLIEGDKTNIKITHNSDISYCEYLLSQTKIAGVPK